MSSPFVWWEVETPAPDAFQAFHAALWGWEFSPAFADSALGRDYWIIQSGGAGIGGLQRGFSSPAAGVRFYLEVDDLETTLTRAVSLGGSVERARTELGGDDRWFANVLDPAGISFGLWTAVEA
jgi:predicted enzyme related to lactoylglutathione lyase